MARPSRLLPRLVGAAGALGLTLAACGDATPATSKPKAASSSPSDPAATSAAGDLPTAVQELDIDGTEYRFDIKSGETLQAGWTKLSFHNTGAQAHQVMFARLKDGVDLASLAAVAGNDPSGSKAIEYVDMIGGVSYIGPDQTVEALVDLPAGIVMAMCYVPDPMGVPHALSGMSTMLTVEPATTAPPTETEAGEHVKGTIVLGPEGYELPSPISRGWYRVENRDHGENGRGLHELSILHMERAPSADELDELLADLAANRTPAIGLEALGGMGALSAGFVGYLYLDLGSGPYLAVDFMPDPGDPRPHLLDGYVATFSV